MDEPTPRELGIYFALAQVGFEMSLPAGLGLILDNWLGWFPWLTISLACLGLVGGFVHMLAILKQQERNEAEKRKKP